MNHKCSSFTGVSWNTFKAEMQFSWNNRWNKWPPWTQFNKYCSCHPAYDAALLCKAFLNIFFSSIWNQTWLVLLYLKDNIIDMRYIYTKKNWFSDDSTQEKLSEIAKWKKKKEKEIAKWNSIVSFWSFRPLMHCSCWLLFNYS